LWSAILAFLAAVAYLVVVAITSADLTNASDDAPLLILAVVGAVSLAGWWRDRARTAALQEKNRLERERLEVEVGEKESALRETREQLGSVRKKEEEQRRTRHELESRLKEREQALNRER
jgi:type VI protein secretion system component VasK